MKSILISIRPKWVEKIASRKKTVEVRGSAPKEVPFKAYIYETYDKKYDDIGICWGNGKCFEHGCKKVIGEFICDKVYLIKNQGSRFSVADEEQSVTNEIARQSCLDYDDMVSYFGNKDGYGLHITDLKIYDKPKELSEFRPICKFDCKDAICALFCPNWKYDGGLFFECTRKVTRPPQSWQYVEELCKAQN